MNSVGRLDQQSNAKMSGNTRHNKAAKSMNLKISQRFEGQTLDQVLGTFSEAGIEAKKNAFYDAKRVAEFIQEAKRENDEKRAQ